MARYREGEQQCVTLCAGAGDLALRQEMALIYLLPDLLSRVGLRLQGAVIQNPSWPMLSLLIHLHLLTSIVPRSWVYLST